MTLRQHKIRAPRKPRGEDLSVTMANQDRQIQLLIDRVEELRKERDELGRKVSFQMADIERLRDEVESYRLTYEAMTEAANRMRGWQDCAREIISPLFPNAPGV